LHSLLDFHPTSIRPYNKLLSALVRNHTSREPCLAIFSFFNRLILTERISPDIRTYNIMINFCSHKNRLILTVIFLGLLLKEGLRHDKVNCTPLLQGLCSEIRIEEIVVIVIYKMPKLRCIPNIFSYNVLIKGIISKCKTHFLVQLLFKMIKHGGECESNVITYSTVIYGLCKGVNSLRLLLCANICILME
jgi:PPR repeat family